MAVTSAGPASSKPLERDARLVNAREHRIRPGEIAVGVIIGRSSEFFDFFVYAIASVLVFPSLVFPYADALTGTLYSFAIFSLAFVARPFGALVFMRVDRWHGRGVKLTAALFLLGGSTAAMAFLPGHAQVGGLAAILLGILRIGQGFAQGGTWDGLPALLSLSAPAERRGWFRMVPQLGAPIGMFVASALFAFLLATLKPADFLDWGWRYPFFVAFVINVVALFARLRLISTPEFTRLYESRELQPSRLSDLVREEGRTVILGAFTPLASFALFHLVTVFPLSWVVLAGGDASLRFLVIELVGAGVGLATVALSGLLADRLGGADRARALRGADRRLWWLRAAVARQGARRRMDLRAAGLRLPRARFRPVFGCAERQLLGQAPLHGRGHDCDSRLVHRRRLRTTCRPLAREHLRPMVGRRLSRLRCPVHARGPWAESGAAQSANAIKAGSSTTLCVASRVCFVRLVSTSGCSTPDQGRTFDLIRLPEGRFPKIP